MTPSEIKSARRHLGLTQAQLAALLETDLSTVRRMEMPPEAVTHRPPPPRAVAMLRAFLEGYRPPNWPENQ